MRVGHASHLEAASFPHQVPGPRCQQSRDLSISSRGLRVAGLDSGAGVSFGGDTEDKHSR